MRIEPSRVAELKAGLKDFVVIVLIMTFFHMLVGMFLSGLFGVDILEHTWLRWLMQGIIFYTVLTYMTEKSDQREWKREQLDKQNRTML